MCEEWLVYQLQISLECVRLEADGIRFNGQIHDDPGPAGAGYQFLNLDLTIGVSYSYSRSAAILPRNGAEGSQTPLIGGF